MLKFNGRCNYLYVFRESFLVSQTVALALFSYSFVTSVMTLVMQYIINENGGFTLKKLLFVFFTVLMMVFLTACDEADVEKVDSESDTEENESGTNEASEDDNSEEPPEAETTNLAIGDSVDFNGLIITLNEVRIEPGGEWDEPSEEQFVVVNLTAENTTDEEESVSSLMNVELKDAESYSYNTTILTEGIKGQFDGSIEPGGTLRGEIPFDVPVSDFYELHFSNPFQSGKAIWKISAEQLAQ